MTRYARRRRSVAGKGRRPGDAGQSAVEFVGWVTVLLIAALAAVQLGFVAYAVQQAGTASRAAARVASQDPTADAGAAGAAATSDWLGTGVTVSGAGGEQVTATATVPIPSVIPLFGFPDARRSTTMPVTTPATD
ncbi:TadE family protein [Streptomyces ficellus]|uniref:Pilus assembly protein n=1 Tax=Streptomyces ficellus TaxID=1977088 RepID=A0A6I6F473_9ACTN|nr:TadE family protein [Streptomyces ficellus]QGV78823.1 pilus assembly protein [Streptomyces ficellus]